jgi:hypothetical protein
MVDAAQDITIVHLQVHAYLMTTHVLVQTTVFCVPALGLVCQILILARIVITCALIIWFAYCWIK